MISSLISRYMIDKITTKETPSLRKNRCINSLQKREKCELCKECCKDKAISMENGLEIDDEKCSNCGICISACPTGTFVPMIEVVEKQYNSINKSDDIIISCSLEAETTDLKVNCLASLPWEFLAYVAIDNNIKLLVKKCEHCKEERLKKQIGLNLERLKIFLGEDEFNGRVTIINDYEKLPTREYTRRELFKMWGEESKRLMTNVAPIKIEQNKNAKIYRSLLLNKLKGKEIFTKDKDKYGWCGIDVNDKCWGCGICARICPQVAIEVKSDENGKRKFIHNYTRCTHCGLCSLVCLDKAPSQVIRKGDGIEVFKEFEVMSLSCLVCNDPIKVEDGDKCIVCKRKEKASY